MKFLVTVFISFILAACGGGGDSPLNPSTVISAVLNDLTATPGTLATSSSTTLCGYDVGTRLIEGIVTNVHDGDTITVNGSNIRLDSIDAPELAQTYGNESQINLARLVMGQYVRVAYTKSDVYDRIVGAVFTGNCLYANLEQVKSGSAWFYKAYQCEISSSVRDLFAQAESSAKATRLGLWSESSPTAPWVYRNGTSPAIPTCGSTSPSWDGNPIPIPVTAQVVSTLSCYKVWVNGYRKANGTYVSGYFRKSPGCP